MTDSIEARLQRLEDLQAINQLFIDYGEHLDAGDFDAYAELFAEDGEVLLGDIILAHGVCVAEAAERGISVEDHAMHLMVHGTLHLLGYDHIDDDEAEGMEQIERDTLAALGLHDPYLITED